MKISKQTPFYIALISAFAISGGVLKAPLYKGSVLPLIAAFIAAIPVLTGFSYVCSSVLCKIKNRNAERIIFTLLAAAAVTVAAFAFAEYTSFVYSAVLLRTGRLPIKAVFAFCVFYVSLSKKEGLYKFAFLSVLLSSAVFIIMFVLSVKNFDLRNLSGICNSDGFSVKQTAVYLIKVFLPSLAAILFIVKDSGKPAALPALSGAALGGVVLTVTLLDTILTFGLPLAAKLTYPYISDISTVTVGNLFTRMDGLAYIALFLCYLLKCAVCINLAATLIPLKYKKALCAILSLSLILL